MRQAQRLKAIKSSGAKSDIYYGILRPDTDPKSWPKNLWMYIGKIYPAKDFYVPSEFGDNEWHYLLGRVKKPETESEAIALMFEDMCPSFHKLWLFEIPCCKCHFAWGCSCGAMKKEREFKAIVNGKNSTE